MKLNAVPAVALAGALTATWVAAAAPTAMLPLVPVIELVVVSVAVTVWLPAVRKVALNVCRPLSPAAKAKLAGNVAAPSVLVTWTVPV